MSKAIRSFLDAVRGLLHARGEPRIGIVALLASSEDRSLISRLAAQHRWIVHQAQTPAAACGLLSRKKLGIVLCDRELLSSAWRETFQTMTSFPQPVYAILISSVADEYLWNEVMRRGGQDLLATPLREADVLRAIRLAWSYWSSSMQSAL